MGTITLEAVAVGNYDSWALQAGSDKIVAIQGPDDDITTYIDNEGVARQNYTFDNLPSVVGTITSFDVRMRAQGETNNASQISCFQRLGGTDLDETFNQFGTSWATFVFSDVGRPGGGVWVSDDFDTVEIGCVKELNTSGSSHSGDVSTIQGIVDFAHIGGFAYLIAQWLPPLLTAASHAVSSKELTKFFKDFKLRPSHREEFEMIKLALLRRPRFA